MADEVASQSATEIDPVYQNTSNLKMVYEEDNVKILKSKLEGWKQVVQVVHSILVWEQSYYPALLAGFVALQFILLWYFEPSVLTTFSVLGIFVCVADYAVPIICTTFLDTSRWTEAQEHKHEDICKSIIHAKQQISELWLLFTQLRETKPKLYFVSVLIILLVLAWIGNVVNNMLLAFLFVLGLVMLPGLKHQGILQKYISQIAQQLKNIVGQKLKKN
ncbi:ADP-ribosylation factor-like protein 6-interacting protein 1 [Limulus polyphemus]|uniref:ADP-ribosylation factor-like protein 6-interacting protein 1 n=1 Tax=Limulus polyphemus TaxID=6850 RepID=A0ABM1B0W2_LIMPO|nr:ADP-ribosylation factor-like protein 6-interacting protein 1 [Limulus polyphemus]